VEVARFPLDHEMQWALDTELDAGSFDAAVYHALMLHGDRAHMGQIYANRRRREWIADMIVHGEEILRQMPLDRQRALLDAGVARLFQNIRDLATILADWAINDEIRGGDLLHIRDRAREDRFEQPWRRIARRLRSPRWIRRYVKHNDDAIRLRRTGRIALTRYSLTPKLLTADDGCAAWDEILDDLEGQRERMRAEQRRAAADLKPSAKGRRDRREKRKVMRRGAIFAAGLLGASTVGALARGKPVTIDGPTVSLQVQRRSSLGSLGHGALQVAVCEPQGRKLADLCIYVDDTPAIDQVSGLALHMQAGLEADVVNAANLIHVTPAGRQHPLLVRRAPARDRYARDRARNDAYWADTAEIWLFTLALFVFGSNRGGMGIARNLACRTE
jgi:hypothetical protein